MRGSLPSPHTASAAPPTYREEHEANRNKLHDLVGDRFLDLVASADEAASVLARLESFQSATANLTSALERIAVQGVVQAAPATQSRSEVPEASSQAAAHPALSAACASAVQQAWAADTPQDMMGSAAALLALHAALQAIDPPASPARVRSLCVMARQLRFRAEAESQGQPQGAALPALLACQALCAHVLDDAAGASVMALIPRSLEASLAACEALAVQGEPGTAVTQLWAALSFAAAWTGEADAEGRLQARMLQAGLAALPSSLPPSLTRAVHAALRQASGEVSGAPPPAKAAVLAALGQAMARGPASIAAGVRDGIAPPAHPSQAARRAQGIRAALSGAPEPGTPPPALLEAYQAQHPTEASAPPSTRAIFTAVWAPVSDALEAACAEAAGSVREGVATSHGDMLADLASVASQAWSTATALHSAGCRGEVPRAADIASPPSAVALLRALEGAGDGDGLHTLRCVVDRREEPQESHPTRTVVDGRLMAWAATPLARVRVPLTPVTHAAGDTPHGRVAIAALQAAADGAAGLELQGVLAALASAGCHCLVQSVLECQAALGALGALNSDAARHALWQRALAAALEAPGGQGGDADQDGVGGLAFRCAVAHRVFAAGCSVLGVPLPDSPRLHAVTGELGRRLAEPVADAYRRAVAGWHWQRGEVGAPPRLLCASGTWAWLVDEEEGEGAAATRTALPIGASHDLQRCLLHLDAVASTVGAPADASATQAALAACGQEAGLGPVSAAQAGSAQGSMDAAPPSTQAVEELQHASALDSRRDDVVARRVFQACGSVFATSVSETLRLHLGALPEGAGDALRLRCVAEAWSLRAALQGTCPGEVLSSEPRLPTATWAHCSASDSSTVALTPAGPGSTWAAATGVPTRDGAWHVGEALAALAVEEGDAVDAVEWALVEDALLASAASAAQQAAATLSCSPMLRTGLVPKAPSAMSRGWKRQVREGGEVLRRVLPLGGTRGGHTPLALAPPPPHLVLPTPPLPSSSTPPATVLMGSRLAHSVVQRWAGASAPLPTQRRTSQSTPAAPTASANAPPSSWTAGHWLPGLRCAPLELPLPSNLDFSGLALATPAAAGQGVTPAASRSGPGTPLGPSGGQSSQPASGEMPGSAVAQQASGVALHTWGALTQLVSATLRSRTRPPGASSGGAAQ